MTGALLARLVVDNGQGPTEDQDSFGPERCPECGAPGLEFIGTDPPERRPGQAIFNVFRCTECGEERRELREGKHHGHGKDKPKPRRGWGLPVVKPSESQVAAVVAAAERAGYALGQDEERAALGAALGAATRDFLASRPDLPDPPRPAEVRAAMEELLKEASALRKRPTDKPLDKALRRRLAGLLGLADLETRQALHLDCEEAAEALLRATDAYGAGWRAAMLEEQIRRRLPRVPTDWGGQVDSRPRRFVRALGALHLGLRGEHPAVTTKEDRPRFSGEFFTLADTCLRACGVRLTNQALGEIIIDLFRPLRSARKEDRPHK